MFAWSDGSPLTYARISGMFRRAREVIGRGELTWHDLRHTGASLAYSVGSSVVDVQARLGHATMRAASIYAHASGERDRMLAQLLNEAYAVGNAIFAPLKHRENQIKPARENSCA